MAKKAVTELKNQLQGKVASMQAKGARAVEEDVQIPGAQSVVSETPKGTDVPDNTQALDYMLNQLNNHGYTPKTADQLQQAAANRFQSVYDQKRLSAQQAYETNTQALDQQLAGLQATYDKQREASAENYANASSQLDRQMVGRGMQRSSYGGATQANLARKGAEAQQDINDAQAAAENNINEQKALAAQQLGRQLDEFNSAQSADELAYLDELENREYERTQQSQARQNELALAINNAQFQQNQAAQDQRNWEASMAFQQNQANREQQNWQAQFSHSQQQAAQAQQNWAHEFSQNQQNWQQQFSYTQQQANQQQQNWAQQFAHEQQQAQQAQSNWQAEFDQRYGKKSGSSSSSSSSSKKTTNPTPQQVPLDEQLTTLLAAGGDRKPPVRSLTY